jgi:putative transposase
VNCGREPSLIVQPHPLFLELGASDQQRQERYRSLFQTPLTDEELSEIRSAANGGFALGSPAFVARIEEELNLRATRGRPGRPARRDSGKRGLSPVSEAMA